MVKFKFLLLVLLLIPLASAETTVEIDASLSLIKIEGTCKANNLPAANLPVGMQASDGVSSVWFNEVKTDALGKFSAQFVPPVKDLTVYVACEGDVAIPKSTSFTVPEVVSTKQTGGGGSCQSVWDCGAWSFCNKDLQQTRTCTDSKHCNVPKNKPNETQSCLACEESWICNNFQNCADGKSYCTNVIDEHACGTAKLKPSPKAQCKDGTKGYVAPAPAKPPKTTPPTIQKPAPSFWDQYMLWIILIPSVILLIIIIVLLILHFRKPHVVYNLNELEDWIKLERNAGTGDVDIRKILHDQTGWKEKDINDAFGALNKNEKK
ncbi:MAG: hypothetical protein CMI53_01705 [Parcubacteria group bacterium]|nr:hypothetical protein [Parcubacteria group bacterium]